MITSSRSRSSCSLACTPASPTQRRYIPRSPRRCHNLWLSMATSRCASSAASRWRSFSAVLHQRGPPRRAHRQHHHRPRHRRADALMPVPEHGSHLGRERSCLGSRIPVPAFAVYAHPFLRSTSNFSLFYSTAPPLLGWGPLACASPSSRRGCRGATRPRSRREADRRRNAIIGWASSPWSSRSAGCASARRHCAGRACVTEARVRVLVRKHADDLGTRTSTARARTLAQASVVDGASAPEADSIAEQSPDTQDDARQHCARALPVDGSWSSERQADQANGWVRLADEAWSPRAPAAKAFAAAPPRIRRGHAGRHNPVAEADDQQEDLRPTAPPTARAGAGAPAPRWHVARSAVRARRAV